MQSANAKVDLSEFKQIVFEGRKEKPLKQTQKLAVNQVKVKKLAAGRGGGGGGRDEGQRSTL